MSVSLPRAWLGEGQRGAMYGAGSLRVAVATSREERFFSRGVGRATRRPGDRVTR